MILIIIPIILIGLFVPNLCYTKIFILKKVNSVVIVQMIHPLVEHSAVVFPPSEPTLNIHFTYNAKLKVN